MNSVKGLVNFNLQKKAKIVLQKNLSNKFKLRIISH